MIYRRIRVFAEQQNLWSTAHKQEKQASKPTEIRHFRVEYMYPT